MSHGDLDPTEELILGVLGEGGGTGIQSSIEDRLEKDRLIPSIDDEVREQADTSSQKIADGLDSLESKGYLHSMGHGEYVLTPAGRQYLGQDASGYLENIIGTSGRFLRARKLLGKFVFILAYILYAVLVVYVAIRFSSDGLSNTFGNLVTFLIIPLLLITLSLYKLNRAKWISGIILRLSKSKTVGSEDAVKSAIANSFRPIVLTLLVIGLSVISIISLQIEVSNQIYGLLFDGIGGGLLAREALTGPERLGSSGVDMATRDYRAETESVNDQFWGATFLIFGFSLQALALVPLSESGPALISAFCRVWASLTEIFIYLSV